LCWFRQLTVPQIESAGKHFDQQVSQYGDVYAINLVNQKGYEKAVKEAFEKAVEQLANPRVHYTYFDFHHECKGLRFDKVSVLLNSLEEEIHNQGYYMADSSSPTPLQTQKSVMRVNCMDCLDRTNVVQSALAQFVLTEQAPQHPGSEGDALPAFRLYARLSQSLGG
jgi:hypothetical protein